ncbi:MAG: hypothetical protein H0V83_07875 [Rubrobacter sp.]|nr:hypothetical protein [Rubrobacter sp.]
MKTGFWIAEGDAAEEWPMCEDCFGEVVDEVFIVPGPVACWGRCSGCLEWFSVRDLVDVKAGAGGRGDAPGGTCRACHEIELGRCAM